MRLYEKIENRKIRMALVGCGRISANHFAAMAQHAGNVELVDVPHRVGRAPGPPAD